MTEIPEHLLKRSRERRAAIGGAEGSEGGGETASDEPAESAAPAEAPVPAAAAAAAVPEPEPEPEPPRPEVTAALSRSKIPYWALPVLAGLPLWAYVYQATLEPAPTGEQTPVDAGGEIYVSSGCSGCHGGGGVGSASVPGFDDVLDVWPDVRDHMMWVRIGNAGWFGASGGSTYGATDKAGNGGVMPAFGSLSDQELAEVVLYERVQFGGMAEEGEDYELLLAIAEGEMTFEEAGLGELSEAAGVDPAALAAG